MNWRDSNISPDGTHHEFSGRPLYEQRFDEVLAFHEPGLAPVRLGDEAWHIHPDGNAAYPHRFARTFGFYEGFATVMSDAGWHHIRQDGTNLYSGSYAWCGNFQDGHCTVRQPDGRYFHLNRDGAPAYGQRWRYAGDFRDGIAVAQGDNGRSTHIGHDGALLHGRWFLDLDVFHKSYARARDEDGWTHIDRAADPLYARRFAAVEPFYNGQARVERFDGALEVIDERGGCLVELRTPLHSEFAALSADMVGFWKTQTIRAAVELGVLDVLPATEEAIAEGCGLMPKRASRLLSALAELRLLERTGMQWRVTPRGAYLQADHPITLADAAIEYGRRFSTLWDTLPDALRGAPRWTAPDIFGQVASEPARMAAHHRMLRSYALHDYGAVPDALDLDDGGRLIDVGGGLGVLALMLIERYPKLQVTLLDRPEVIEQARTTLPSLDRIELRSGDFLEPWQIHGDAVLMSRILHDWDDTAALRILRHARSALPVGGRLFIVEMLLPEDGVAGGLSDLHLLVATGGQERKPREYAELLRQAGFELMRITQLPALPSLVIGEAR